MVRLSWMLMMRIRTTSSTTGEHVAHGGGRGGGDADDDNDEYNAVVMSSVTTMNESNVEEDADAAGTLQTQQYRTYVPCVV
jgi:hypothetical protein